MFKRKLFHPDRALALRALTGMGLALMFILGTGAISNTKTLAGTGQWRDRGWDRDRRGGLSSTGRRAAEENGYRTGLDRGRDDGRDGRSSNPNNSEHYRDGDSGYHSEFGSREAYKQTYRAAFRRGYSEGYRQTSRRRWRR